MNGEEAYVLSKALTASAAAGIKNYNISSSGLLTMETSDGQILSYQFHEPVSCDVNENNHLIITYTNGSTQDAGVITTLKGDKGDPGNDGYSPVATVSKVGDTATITIRDKTGETTETIKDGQDGQDGQDGTDGYAPQVSVNTSTSDTYTLDITYKDETTGEVETFTTPNLKGSEGGSDDPLTPEQLESLINILI